MTVMPSETHSIRYPAGCSDWRDATAKIGLARFNSESGGIVYSGDSKFSIYRPIAGSLNARKIGVGPIRRLFGMLLLIAVALCFAGPAFAVQNMDLVVVVKSLRSTQGLVHIAIWRDPEGFTEPDAVLMTSVRPADADHLVFVFQGVARGRYAMASYHDENSNGELDLTWIGLPEEGLGFSNNAWIGLGPPSFEEAGVEVRSTGQVIEISLRY